jgi:hypothetical protein
LATGACVGVTVTVVMSIAVRPSSSRTRTATGRTNVSVTPCITNSGLTPVAFTWNGSPAR